jgi:hypothetical protein
MSSKPESFYWKYSSAITYALMAWAIIGFFAYFGLIFTFRPWTGALGVAGAAPRIFFMGLGCYVYMLPLPLLCCHLYTQHQEWVAEDNGQKYEKGKYYKTWTTKTIITMALSMALFGASGAIRVVDIPGIVMTFVNILYGPVVAFFGLGLGYFFIRGPIFLGQFDFFQLSRNLIYDGGHAAISAFMWRKWIRTKWQLGKMSTPVAFVFYSVLRWWFHLTSHWVTTKVWTHPDPIYLVTLLTSFTVPRPPLMVPGFLNGPINHAIGFFMAIAVTKYVWPPVREVRTDLELTE